MKKILYALIVVYQRIWSPDHSPRSVKYPYGYCRFYPSCSEYAKKSLEKYGIVKGLAKTTARIVRCNPWSKGGIDQP